MDNFTQILEFHKNKYPLMKPADYAKLAYQSEYGPEHMVRDESTALRYIAEEMKEFSSQCERRFPETIGNGLCRFFLDGEADIEVFAPVLAKLFYMTAKRHKGSREGMERRLAILEQTDIADFKEFLADYRQNGCPPVHHSQTYREAYHPHYRLLLEEYALYFPVFLEIQTLLQKKNPVIVAIDGRCGSGKTKLAELIAEVFSCNLFHMDDYYLPLSEREKDWQKNAGANMDFSRFSAEVLQPVREGRDATYRPYDCRSGCILRTDIISCKQLNVVEGSYSHHPNFSGQYDLKVFLTCSGEIQAARLKEREGSYYPVFERQWIPLEEQYIQKYSIFENTDLSVDTTNL